MRKNWVKGKRIIAKALAGFMAALMVVSLVPLGTVNNLKTVKAASGTLTPADILGDAYNYGIVAEKLEQTNHMQTNYAVKAFENTGNVNIDPDLITAETTGQNVIIPFYAGSIKGTARLDNFKAGVSDRKQVIFYVGKDDKEKVKVKSPSNVTFYVMPEEKETIENNVAGMLSSIVSTSNSLYNRTADIAIQSGSELENQDQNHYEINIAEGTYESSELVIISVADDASVFWAAMAAGGLHIKKKSNQKILFNIAKEDLELNRFKVLVTDADNSKYTGVTGTDVYVQTDSPIDLGPKNIFLRDEVMDKIIWNVPKASKLSVRETAGLFLATRDNVTVTLNSTSTGWMVANGTFHQESGEWHFPHITSATFSSGDVQGDLTIIVYKEYLDSNGNIMNAPAKQSEFKLYTDEACTKAAGVGSAPGTPLEVTAKTERFNGKNAAFFPFNLPVNTSSETKYFIKEIYDAGSGFAKNEAVVQVTVKHDGNSPVVEYKIIGGDTIHCAENSAKYPVFKNRKTEDSSTGSINLGKRIENASGSSVQWNDVKGNIEFKVYDVTSVTGDLSTFDATANEPIRTVSNSENMLEDKNGNRTYDVTLEGLEYGDGKKYLIVETKNGLDADGKVGSFEYNVSSTVTTGVDPAVADTLITIANGLKAFLVSDFKADKTVTFTNKYEKKNTVTPKGKLTIKKEISAPAGETAPKWDDLKDNIEFVITKSDDSIVKTVKGSDPKFSDSTREYEIELEPGVYKIKETKSGFASTTDIKGEAVGAVDGKKYVVSSNPAGEVSVSVTSNGNVKKTFTNTYSSREEGTLTITKKFVSTDGSITSWDDMKGKISFEAVSADGTKKETINATESDVTVTGSGDTWTFTWKVPGDFPIGSYTVTEKENGLDSDGKYNGDKYTITTTGDSGTPGKHVVTISYNKNTDTGFTNTYTKQEEDKGSITINKIVTTPSGQSSVPNWISFRKDVEFTIEGADGTKEIIKGDDKRFINQSITLPNLKKQKYTITETKNGLRGNSIGGVEYTVDTTYGGNGTLLGDSYEVDLDSVTNAAGTVNVTNNYKRIRPESIYISKKEVGGSNELPNAKMELYVNDASGGWTLLEAWTTQGTGNHKISGDILEKGKSYKIVETLAPVGQIVATDITFNIDADGKIEPTGSYASEFNEAPSKRIITMFDGVIGDVKLVKKFSDAGISRSLAQSALIGLYSDEACTKLIDQKNPVWSSVDSKYIVTFPGKNLTTGKVYYLKEVKAPAGYDLSGAKYSCSIDANGTLTYSCLEKDSHTENTIDASGLPVCYNFAKTTSETAERTGSITLTGINKVVDKTGNGAPNENFYYEVREGNVVKLTGIVPNEGDIIFGTIEYTEKDRGKHTYTVTEKKGTTDGMTYDVASKTITVTVSNDVRDSKKLITSVSGNNSSTVFTFNNVYTGPGTTPPPVTPTTNSTVGGSTTNSSATVMDPILVRKVFLDGKVGTYNMERSGCYFTLYTDPSCKPEYAIADAKEIEAVWSTAENQWMLYIRSLIVPVGNVYYLKEVKAPTGYKINDTVWDCIVGTNGTVTYRDHATGTGVNSVICQNVKKKQTGGSTEKAPKTGDPVNAALPIGVVTLLGLASVFCFMKAGRKRGKAERTK